MLRKTLLRFLPLVASLVGCRTQPIDPNAFLLRIGVFADGHLTVDGAVSSIDELREAVQRAREQRGVVLYYREAAATQPPPIAKDVLKAITDARLPIGLSTRPDYSDLVGPDGKLRTR